MLQLTIGRTAAQAAAATASSAAARLSTLIDAARADLRTRGIVLPEALIQSDDQLDSVVSFIGLERHADQVTSLDELVALLTERVAAISASPLDLAGVRALLAQAVTSVAADKYEQALSQYNRAYYHSEPHGYQAEVTRCLNDAGNIYLRNGDLATATALLQGAVQTCHEPSPEAAGLQPLATLNLATAQLLAGGPGDLTAGFRQAGQEACDSRSSVLAFVALIGWARACCLLGDDAGAATALKGAAQLVAAAPGGEAGHAASILGQAISEALAAVSGGSRLAEGSSHGHSVFSDLELSAANALTASLPSGAVCKVFTVNGGSSLSLFGTNYDLRDPVLESVDVIDDTIIQNMKIADDTIIQNMKLTRDQDPA